jgi:hypothetical protein
MAHVAEAVLQRCTETARSRAGKELPREIESVNAKSCFGEQVGMPALTTRHVEDPCTGVKSENLDEPRDLLAASAVRRTAR